MNPHRYSPRTNSAARREVSRIKNDLRWTSIDYKEGEETTESFMVKRRINPSSKQKAFDLSRLNLFDHLGVAKLKPKQAVSLIHPADGLRAVGLSQDDNDETMARLKTLNLELPPTLTGFVGGIGVLGAGRGSQGRRHIALMFNKGLADQLREERRFLLEGIGVKEGSINSRYTPHASVAITSDQEVAESCKDILDASKIVGTPVILDRPYVLEGRVPAKILDRAA